MSGFSSALCEVNKWDRGKTGFMAKGALLVSIYLLEGLYVSPSPLFKIFTCWVERETDSVCVCVCVCAHACVRVCACVCVCVLCVERLKTKQKHEGFLLFSLKLSYFTIMAMCMTLKGI